VHAACEFADFLHGDEPDERLVELFATFPFRMVEVNGSTYKLNADEFESEFENLR
jgi:hypothetical protein